MAAGRARHAGPADAQAASRSQPGPCCGDGCWATLISLPERHYRRSTRQGGPDLPCVHLLSPCWLAAQGRRQQGVLPAAAVPAHPAAAAGPDAGHADATTAGDADAAATRDGHGHAAHGHAPAAHAVCAARAADGLPHAGELRARLPWAEPGGHSRLWVLRLLDAELLQRTKSC